MNTKFSKKILFIFLTTFASLGQSVSSYGSSGSSGSPGSTAMVSKSLATPLTNPLTNSPAKSPLKGIAVPLADVELLRSFVDGNIKKTPVIEFFWYGCSHCQELEPGLAKWAKEKSDKVQLIRIPSPFGAWAEDAKIYFALAGAGLKTEQNSVVFDFYAKRALSRGPKPTLSDIIGIVQPLGLEENKIRAAYGSFDTDNKLRKAKELLKFYKIDGVPALLINNNYLTGAAYAGTPKDILEDLTLAVNSVPAK